MNKKIFNNRISSIFQRLKMKVPLRKQKKIRSVASMVKKLRRLENTLLLYNSRPLSARAAARPPAAFLRSREFPAYIWARKLCLGVQQKLIPES